MTVPDDTKILLVLTHEETFRAPTQTYIGPFEDAEQVRKHVEVCEYDKYEIEYSTHLLYAPEVE